MRVLLVEDDPLTSEWLSILLRANDFETKSASSVAAAIECINNWMPHMIITDVGLAGLLDYLITNSLLSQIRIVGVSGYMLTDRDRQRFDAFLLKPVDPSHLLSVIRKII
jgi:DNA-binding response OmpR family regulator